MHPGSLPAPPSPEGPQGNSPVRTVRRFPGLPGDLRNRVKGGRKTDLPKERMPRWVLWGKDLIMDRPPSGTSSQ